MCVRVSLSAAASLRQAVASACLKFVSCFCVLLFLFVFFFFWVCQLLPLFCILGGSSIGESISKMRRGTEERKLLPRPVQSAVALLTDVDIVAGQPHGIKSDSPQDILYLIYSVTALGPCPPVRLSVCPPVRLFLPLSV